MVEINPSRTSRKSEEFLLLDRLGFLVYSNRPVCTSGLTVDDATNQLAKTLIMSGSVQLDVFLGR